MNRRGFLVFALCVVQINFYAQGFSLKQCIEYASLNNGDIKKAKLDLQIANKKVTEQVGTYLPQINGSSELTDNLKLGTQLLPAEMFGGEAGTSIPITMGTKYSWSSGLQLSQSIYNPTSLGNIKSAKINKTLSSQSQSQVEESTVYNVSVAYYNCLVIQKQLYALNATLKSSEESLNLLQLKFKNGMAKKIDVDKVRVSYNNIQSQLDQTQLSYIQSINTLKYKMGMPVESSLELEDINLEDSNSLLQTIYNDSSDFRNRIDYQINQTNLKLQENNKKQSVAAFLPSVSFSASYNYNGMQQEFNFFDDGQEWYESSAIGVKISVPIFDGLQKQSRLSQAKLNVEKSKESLRMAEQSIKLEIENYETQYQNSIDNIKKEKDNLDLAGSVYEETQLQYKQGMATSLELVQAESSLREAQNNYFNKLLNFYIARINLEKSKGNLINYIKTQI